MPVSDLQDDTFGTNENKKHGPKEKSFVSELGIALGEEDGEDTHPSHD